MTELYFSGHVDNFDLMLAELREAHEKLVSDIIPFVYMNNEGPKLRAAFDGECGLAARGPRPLLEVYAQVIEFHGCKCSLLDRSDLHPEILPQSEVLVLAPIGFVLSNDFAFKRFASSKKMHQFVQKQRGW